MKLLPGYTNEQPGYAWWIGHILNHLQLTDHNSRKAYSDGQMYAFEREDAPDMMRRYSMLTIER